MPSPVSPVRPADKPPWRYAVERRLGREAKRLVDVAEAQIAWSLAQLDHDHVLAASRRPRWALACIERAADCDEGSRQQLAWVYLAASRPRLVRQAIHARR